MFRGLRQSGKSWVRRRDASFISICLPRRPESCSLNRVASPKSITIATILLAVILAPGCKRPSAESADSVSDATNAAAPVQANSRSKDLGVVLLTNRCETRIEVGDGKSCVIKPQVLDAQHLRLTMTLESRLSDGKTRGLKVLTVLAKPDQPFEVDFGTLAFSLTPQLATNPSPEP